MIVFAKAPTYDVTPTFYQLSEAKHKLQASVTNLITHIQIGDDQNKIRQRYHGA
jgi:hypothetical protein